MRQGIMGQIMHMRNHAVYLLWAFLSAAGCHPHSVQGLLNKTYPMFPCAPCIMNK